MLPLHHTPIQALADSNRRLSESKSDVLPIELSAYEVPDRIRTRDNGIAVRRLTTWLRERFHEIRLLR